MTPEEACEIINLATKKWHDIAESHDFPHCNCFKEEFGRALTEKYGFSNEEMINAWRKISKEGE